MTASITKEKFGARERANFDHADAVGGKDVEDEADLVHLAEMSNHSYLTFNQAYAGSTTLTMSTLLHRAYRASESWRNLFAIDSLLVSPQEEQGRGVGEEPGGVKRPRADSGSPSLLLAACKKARLRTRATYDEAALLAVARTLYDDPALQFRVPGQRNGVLAVLGRRPSEQAVLILATGSGKTLLVMVGAALRDAGTTILILPTVALRGDMLVRLGRVGVRYLVWSPASTQSAPLVIVSAEAACT